MERCRSAFLDGYAPDDATLARLPGYCATTRLRLAGVYAFRDTVPGLFQELVTVIPTAVP